ncbi:S1 RNA-binding domain-containing protein 1-like [Glandiceps talaboti]
MDDLEEEVGRPGSPVDMLWDMSFALAESENIDEWVANNITQLVDDGCTIPFIARYRKENTKGMEPDKLREVVSAYDQLKRVQNKAANVIKQIKKVGKMDDSLNTSIRCARTMEELDHLYTPYKTGSKTTLAERARKLGLESAATLWMKSPGGINIQSYVKPEIKGLSSIAEVNKGIQHIIADTVAKDVETMTKIRELCSVGYVTIQSSKKTKPAEDEKAYKFERYYDFSCTVKNVKPHQVLAMNRGENLKILTIKVIITDGIVRSFKTWCSNRWVPRNCNQTVKGFIQNCIDDSYTRLIQPLVVRQTRSELTKKAENASIEVFSHNLKRLLLTPPVRGKVVLGVDPGFRHGCKLAMLSPLGQILFTDVMYIHDNRRNREAMKIKNMLINYSCETLAIGNGTACRETESFFSNLITSGFFRPLNVMYCIVDEAGASIYSVSDDAQTELPNMDANLRSAVSIGRRLQDPLIELVKIEPKHLGVGMYQHDVSASNLKGALDSVVEECASFVGIDLNVCTESLLRRIAGLSASRATKIIEWRNEKGSFTNREQLKSIKGLGPKTYEQCAGFVRINPQTIQRGTKEENETEQSSSSSRGKRKAGTSKSSKSKKAKTVIQTAINPLDMTCIHPESYHIAEKFLKKMDASVAEMGQSSMRTKMDRTVRQYGMDQLAEEFEVGLPTLQLIMDGLKQPLDYDIRAKYEKPLFRQGLMSVNDLQIGTILTGRVCNVVQFGAFVDIGVGQNGLIHNSAMPAYRLQNGKPLGPGDKVQVKVTKLEISKGRIALELITVL